MRGAARASYALEFQAVAVATEFEGTAASERPRKHGLSTVGDDTKKRPTRNRLVFLAPYVVH